MKAEKLYKIMPSSFQNIAVSLYGYNLIKKRYGANYKEIERQLFMRELWEEQQFNEHANIQIQKIVHFAYKFVPYYKRLFEELSLNPGDIKTPNDLSLAIPVLNKNQVQEQLNDFIPSCLSQRPYFSVKTSGTTGKGMVFPMTYEADRLQWATWWRYRSRFGLNRQTWYAHFYGKSIVPFQQIKPPFWRINYPGKQILFSAYHMQKNNLSYYIDVLNKYKPPWIQGYPSLLSIVAEYILETKALNYSPHVITIGSESLLSHQKFMIEKAFRAPCRQHYGLTEATANISECPEGNLHVDEDFGYVEFLKNMHGFNEIISTGYANEAFVLLRYNTGDTATLPSLNGSCRCGRAGRLVTDIDGRIEDFIITPDGRKIGRLDHIVKDMVNIKECQIIQDKIDHIVIKIVKGNYYTDYDEKKLLLETVDRVGTEMIITPKYVDSIPRSKTGKLRFVISEL